MTFPTLADQLDRYRRHFLGPHLDLVIESMLAGNTAGQLWVSSDGDSRPLLLLWDKGNDVFYLSGEAARGSSLDRLAATIASDVLPRALEEGMVRFKVRALLPSLEEKLPTLFPGIALHTSRTLFFVHNAQPQIPLPPTTVPGVSYLPITREVLSTGGLEYRDHVRAEIRSMWPSEERFHERGVGVVAALDGAIFCWCTSEYVGPDRCGIGIATSPRYEGRGLATATACHFVQEARSRGITACWECDSANRGSVRVAEKTGFVLQSEETYWVGSFPEPHL